MIKTLVNYLGRDPQRSMSLFMKGLGLFVLGLGLIALGYYYHYYWQILGVLVLALAIAIAGLGYIGLFAYRLQRIFTRTRPKW